MLRRVYVEAIVLGSEGELKKRILNLSTMNGYAQWIEKQSNKNAVRAEYELCNQASEIVDEAKQDILSWWSQHPKFVGVKEAPEHYTDIEKFYYARDAWLEILQNKLEHWFGDST